MNRYLLTGALLVMASPTLAETPRQFDLHCEALRHWRDGTNAVDPITVHIRVDLDRREWCDKECQVTFQIDDISAMFVRFRNADDLIIKDDNSDATPTKEEIVVSRTTGTYADSKWHPFERGYWSAGRCEVQPFSGFAEPPSRLF